MDSYFFLILMAVALAVLVWWLARNSGPAGSKKQTPGPNITTPGLSLVCVQGPLMGQAFPFRRAWLTIGRDRDNAIVIEGALVSRHHAMVSTGPPGIVLADLGSTNGTWLAGRNVLEQPLNQGDAFQIGPCVFALTHPNRVGNAPVVAPPPVAAPPVSRNIPSVSLDMAGSVKIAAYDRQELIGEGGAAYVYKMRHRGGQMYAALKVLKESAHPDFRRRFADEMNIGRLLKHPYIVTVYDTGEIDGMNFILMEYLEGRSLRDRLNRPVNVATATAIIGQIGQALDYAHSRGVFHRDIKPENILFTADNVAKLADFGIAKLNGMRRLTSEGMLIGTPEYMSFDQAKGMAIDGRSDQYSLAIVLYEMLTGQPPFTGRNPLSIVDMHMREAPTPPRRINPAVPPQIETVIMRALSKDRNRRYPTLGDMSGALGYRGRVATAAPAPSQSAAGLRPARLVHLTTGQSWPLSAPNTELGRQMINDPHISRHHALIRQDGRTFFIEDLDSHNGTLVDGSRVVSPTVLSPGARIRLGPVPFQFLVDG